MRLIWRRPMALSETTAERAASKSSKSATTPCRLSMSSLRERRGRRIPQRPFGSVPTLEQHLLHFVHRYRREDLHEREEQQREPGDRPERDHHLDEAWPLEPPAIGRVAL